MWFTNSILILILLFTESFNLAIKPSALNSLKVSPQDIISIFQALKESGALVAELVII